MVSVKSLQIALFRAQKAGSESELASDAGEDASCSAAEQSDGASVHEAEYVNPRGVRFMPHQQHRDGQCTMCGRL